VLLRLLRFKNLIAEMHEKTGQKVVVLVDEYNKPLLNTMNKPDVNEKNQEYTERILRGSQRR
jgi:ribulose 1,5-bisphosphate carboxylase large subunit-like protein